MKFRDRYQLKNNIYIYKFGSQLISPAIWFNDRAGCRRATLAMCVPPLSIQLRRSKERPEKSRNEQNRCCFILIYGLILNPKFKCQLNIISIKEKENFKSKKLRSALSQCFPALG